MQWLQDTNQINVDNQNYVRHEVSRHFRNKAKEYLFFNYLPECCNLSEDIQQ